MQFPHKQLAAAVRTKNHKYTLYMYIIQDGPKNWTVFESF